MASFDQVVDRWIKGTLCICFAVLFVYLYMHRDVPLRVIFGSDPFISILFISSALAGLILIPALKNAEKYIFKIRVRTAPGVRLQLLARFFSSHKTYREVLEPTLLDLLDEYCAALQDKSPWRARWIRIRGYWSFWAAVVAQIPISAVKLAYKIWKVIP